MERISFEQINQIQNQINKNQQIQRSIQKEIQILQYNLNEVKLEEQLLYFKVIGPHLVHADSTLSKYQYLSKSVTLDNIGITLFPVWLSLECTYPRWTKDIYAINIVICEGENQYEVLIDGLHKSFGCSYEQCTDLIKRYNIEIPPTHITNYTPNSNISIDFSKGSALDFTEHRKKNYYLMHSEDDDMVINQAKIKYIFSIPTKLMHFIDNDPRDILEYI